MIEQFLAGSSEGEAASLRIDGCQLIHYNTAIAERYEGKVLLNYTRYSLASGKVQKILIEKIPPEKLVIVKNVPAETRGTLVQFSELSQRENLPIQDALMVIDHKVYGKGFVTLVSDQSITVQFHNSTKRLMYPMVFDAGIATIVEDLRDK